MVDIPSSKIRKIFNGLPVASIKEMYFIPIDPSHETIFDKPTVLSVRKIDYPKGHEFLIAAHAHLLQSGVDHNLIIIGVGPDEEGRRKQVALVGAANSVFFLGFQKNPFAYMRRSMTFALSSRCEGMPLVIVEAMACVLPVVSVDCHSGPREVLENGKCGILVKTGDPVALANGLRRMLSDMPLRENYINNSLARSAEFDIGNIAVDSKNVFKEIV